MDPSPLLPRLNSDCTAVAHPPPCPHISLENSTQVARNEEGEGGEGGGSPGPSSPSPLVPELPCLAACEDQVGEKGLTHVQLKFKCLSTSSSYRLQLNLVTETSSSFPNSETFHRRKEFCLVVEKLLGTCKTKKARSLANHFPNSK